LILFSYFLPFSKKQTAPTFVFTAISQAAFFLGSFLGPLGTLPGPPGARSPFTTVTPVTPDYGPEGVHGHSLPYSFKNAHEFLIKDTSKPNPQMLKIEKIDK
jgi:hypothetical protein